MMMKETRITLPESRNHT